MEDYTYLGVLVGGLLPLLAHGLGQRLAHHVDAVEEDDGREGELGHLRKNLPALALGGLGAGTVRPKCDPVGYITEVSASVLDRTFRKATPDNRGKL